MVSAALYEKRFGSYFCAPVIAGLEEDGTPYLCGMDSIGAMVRKGITYVCIKYLMVATKTSRFIQF